MSRPYARNQSACSSTESWRSMVSWSSVRDTMRRLHSPTVSWGDVLLCLSEEQVVELVRAHTHLPHLKLP